MPQGKAGNAERWSAGGSGLNRVQVPEGPRLLDHPREGGTRDKAGETGAQAGVRLRDRVDPARMEQRRRRRAVGQREGAARRPGHARFAVQPGLGGVEVRAAAGDAGGVVLGPRQQGGVDDLLHAALDPVVEHAVQEADPQAVGAVAGQAGWAGPGEAEMRDDRGRPGHRRAAVQQHRKARQRPQRGQCDAVCRIAEVDEARPEKDAAFV